MHLASFFVIVYLFEIGFLLSVSIPVNIKTTDTLNHTSYNALLQSLRWKCHFTEKAS